MTVKLKQIENVRLALKRGHKESTLLAVLRKVNAYKHKHTHKHLESKNPIKQFY